MGSFGNFVAGLAIGAAVGVAVVMFTAPRTGTETRGSLASYWNNALDSGKRAAKAREDELWAEFNTRVRSQGPTGTTP